MSPAIPLAVLLVAAPSTGLATPAAAKTEEAFGPALDRALVAGWHDLRLEAECQTEDGLSALEVLGNGVATWNGAVQFRLPPATLRTLLETLRDGGFADLRGSYGGKGDPLLPVNQAPRVTCRIGLQIDGRRKDVVQLQGGRQSEAFLALARRLLAQSRPPEGTGEGAADLEDGLRKIAGGTLAPEALHLVVHRTGRDMAGGGAQGERWLLRVDGRRASVRRPPESPGRPEPPVELELEGAEVVRLAQQLAGATISALPGNLYADDVTDLTVAVLDRRKNVQARRFAGLKPTTHGERQLRFDRLLEQLGELQRRVAKAGHRAEPGAEAGPEGKRPGGHPASPASSR